MPNHERHITPDGLLHLFLVYVIWGSTYLAIRLAVREGAGFPPFTLGAMRVLVAGSLLILWAKAARHRVRLGRGEIIILAWSGFLLWFGGNGLVIWAEQRADSGYAALLVGSMPIWVALIEAVLDRRPPSLFLTGSLLTGFAGIGLLSAPVLLSGVRADVLAVIALLIAPISWGIGSVLQSRRPVAVSPRVSSGYQQLFGGVAFALAAILFGEPMPTPTREAWLAWGYLIVFGSIIAFTSFVYTLRLLPTNIAMTYAYVNPVVAVIVGRIVLDEPITEWTFGGSVLVILGVAGVFHERRLQSAVSARIGSGKVAVEPSRTGTEVLR